MRSPNSEEKGDLPATSGQRPSRLVRQLFQPAARRETPPGGFSFSDEDVALRRYARRRMVHTQQVPQFRLAGMALLVFVAWMFELVGTSASGGHLLVRPLHLTWVLLTYCLVSWLSLRLFYNPDSVFDLSVAWLLADYLPLLLFLYTVDGIDQWIALVLALRFTDQSDEGPARTLLFVSASILLYLGAAAAIDQLLLPLDFDQVVLIATALVAAGIYATMRSSSSRYLRDRTRAAVRAARSLVRRLEDRGRLLEEQTVELTAARARAEQASQSKNHFLANVSHEIRTPLNGLIGMIDILFDSKLDDQQVEHLATVRKSANSLLSLLNDILDLTKIEAGKLQTERIGFSLRDLVQDVVALTASAAPRQDLEVSARFADDVPDRVVGDPARLRQILTNLLSNARKFTRQGTIEVVVLSAPASQPGDPSRASLRFEVRDTGIGIDPQKVEEVFEAFVQADESTTRRFGGTGLGLAICRQLVMLMNGEMGAESAPGEGSVFWFELPFEVSHTMPGRDTTGSMPLRARRALLLGEASGSDLKRRLKPWGVSLREAADGEQVRRLLAEAKAKGRPYELLLVPVQSGGALREAEWRGLHHEIPVLLLSSKPLSGDELLAAEELGAAAALRADVPDYRIAYALRLLLEGDESLPMVDDALLDRQSPKHRVLLVEDNRVNQQVAMRHLEKGGYEVTVANNGREAVDRFAGGSFDIVLMDLQMPEVDGYQAARQIRELPGGVRVPIVAVTAHALQGDREAVLAAGLDDYLAKPISPARLFEVIERNLASAPEAAHSLFRR